MTFSYTKFEFFSSNGLGGDAFISKYIILCVNLTSVSTSKNILKPTAICSPNILTLVQKVKRRVNFMFLK